jgi:hypothetical protein
MAEVAAERIANATPIMHFHVDEAVIKIISLLDFARILLVAYR